MLTLMTELCDKSANIDYCPLGPHCFKAHVESGENPRRNPFN